MSKSTIFKFPNLNLIFVTLGIVRHMIQENINLKAYHTFGMDCFARYFTEIHNEDQARKILEWIADNGITNTLIIGGGSNLLFTKDFDGLIIHNKIKGIRIVDASPKEIWVEVGAGENWYEFVQYALEQHWGGIENLSLIPGSVGASPMQNIGAYGVEIKDVFSELQALDLKTAEIKYFNRGACKFGYRESIFKNSHKNKYWITRVTFRLTKVNHSLNTSYGAIEQELDKQGVKSPSIQDVSKAVIAIRQAKLPDPKKLGNAGSFFKNPIVSLTQLQKLQLKCPNIVFYPINDEYAKVAAAWLIDQLGYKGKTINGSYGVHQHQALVLVNYGGAKGKDIMDLSEEIIQKVKTNYQITLEREVNIIA